MLMWDSTAAAPLEGLSVIDLSRFVCGNMLTLLLADFGADVVKVEDPKKGDPLRALREDGVSVFWKVYARNKRSLALDLRRKAARAVVLDLVERAAVFVESFRVGTLEKMQLGPEVLLGRNPNLVIVRISGFGQTGAYRDRPGFGTLIEAMSGFAAKNGFPDRPPALPNMALADMVAGLYGAFAVIMAVRNSERGGRGQVIDLSLLEPLVSILGPDPAIYALSGKQPSRTGSRSDAVAPRNVYRTRDGLYVAISASVQSMADRLFNTLGRSDMIDDPKFRTNSDRMEHIDEVDRVVQDWVSTLNRDQCLAILQEAEVTVAPVYDIRAFIADEHVKTRRVLIDAPDAEAGQILMHNIIPRLSETPGALRRPAPEIGRDSEEVLSEIGYDSVRIVDLVERGIITLGPVELPRSQA